MMSVRWPDGKVTCPRCGSDHVIYLDKASVWKCHGKHDHAKFSLKTGTIFEDSPLPLNKWLTAVWMITSAKNGVSSYEIHRSIGVTHKTAWFMLQRIRLAMRQGHFDKASGHVEVDETFIGGKARNLSLIHISSLGACRRPFYRRYMSTRPGSPGAATFRTSW